MSSKTSRTELELEDARLNMASSMPGCLFPFVSPGLMRRDAEMASGYFQLGEVVDRNVPKVTLGRDAMYECLVIDPVLGVCTPWPVMRRGSNFPNLKTEYVRPGSLVIQYRNGSAADIIHAMGDRSVLCDKHQFVFNVDATLIDPAYLDVVLRLGFMWAGEHGLKQHDRTERLPEQLMSMWLPRLSHVMTLDFLRAKVQTMYAQRCNIIRDWTGLQNNMDDVFGALRGELAILYSRKGLPPAATDDPEPPRRLSAWNRRIVANVESSRKRNSFEEYLQET